MDGHQHFTHRPGHHTFISLRSSTHPERHEQTRLHRPLLRDSTAAGLRTAIDAIHLQPLGNIAEHDNAVCLRASDPA